MIADVILFFGGGVAFEADDRADAAHDLPSFRALSQNSYYQMIREEWCTLVVVLALCR